MVEIIMINDIDVEAGLHAKDFKIPPFCTYTKHKELTKDECGKNKSACLVFSQSRQNSELKKMWVFKPLVEHKPLEGSLISRLYQYYYQTFVSIKYDLEVATIEVFFGKLAASIFGKTCAPNTKFNLNERGIVSRVIGDEAIQNKNLYQFIILMRKEHNTYLELSGDSLISFLDSFLYACVIGNSDIHVGNMVVQFHTNHGLPIPTKVYGIDHEHAVFKSRWHRGAYTVKELLSIFYRNPNEIKYALSGQKFAFQQGSFDPPRRDLPLYFKSITKKLFIERLTNIVDAISANEFKTCYVTRNNIHKKFTTRECVYTTEEVDNIILPKIDDAIIELKHNVEEANEFLKEVKRGITPSNPQRCIQQ